MLEKIKEIVAGQLDIDAETLTEATDFEKDLQADSLDLYEMSMTFEDEFNVQIPTEDLEDIHTVGDVVTKIEALLAEN